MTPRDRYYIAGREWELATNIKKTALAVEGYYHKAYQVASEQLGLAIAEYYTARHEFATSRPESINPSGEG